MRPVKAALVTGLALVVMGGLSGCGGHELKGAISVIEQLGLGSADRIGQGCSGTGGYDDIQAGTSVVVSDENGKVLATGHLDAGKISALETCRFTFDLNGVPDASFYQVEVSHRGKVTFSSDDLSKKGWQVDLTLG